MYESYKNARNQAWKTLIECNIDKLPIDLGMVARHHNIKVIAYSKTTLFQVFDDKVKNGDGFIAIANANKEIFINDKINNRNRRRFTMAHELGHAILKHDIGTIHYRNSEMDNQDDLQEFEANIFARDLLMPSTVLAALNIRTVEEIMSVCHISRQSAEIRAARMKELYQRNLFNIHPLEIETRELFNDFIINYRKQSPASAGVTDMIQERNDFV